ncbi:MAG: hypothetical protein R3F29_05295 [Planctomycetota bacterium]
MANGTNETRSKLLLGTAVIAALAAATMLVMCDGPSPATPGATSTSPEPVTTAPSPTTAAAVGSAVIDDAEPTPEQPERTAYDGEAALRALVRGRLLTMKDDPTPYSRTADALRVAKAALDDVRINPHHKQLDELRLAQFSALVHQHAEHVGVAFDRAAGLRAEAMLRSVHADRFTFHVQPDGQLPDLAAGDDRHRTSATTGIPAHDLICRTSLHNADNGDFIHVVTYVTRELEPDYFFAAELVEQLRQQQERELRSFVATLP